MDGWLCGDCRSLNTPRAKSCYRCNVPRRFGESAQDPESVAIIRDGALATALPAHGSLGDVPGLGALPPGAAAAAAARPRPSVVDARSSRGRSRVLLLLLVATTAWTALSTSMVLARGGTMGLVMDLLGGDQGVVPTVVLVGLLGTLLSLATAIVWFVWFDRVLRNVPALTGQWPDSGRVGAVGWWLVPIVGFIKAPRIVGDVYHRLSVEGTPGVWLLALWALTWIGGTVGPAIASRLVAFLPFGLEVFISLSDLITLLGQASYVAAGILAIALVTSIEHASAVRLDGGGTAVARPSDATTSDVRLAGALRAAAEANAAVKVAQLGTAGARSAGSVAFVGYGGSAADAEERPLLRPIQRPPAAGAAATTRVSPAVAAGARPIVATGQEAPARSLPGMGGVATPAGWDSFGEPTGRRRSLVPRWAMGMAGVAVLLAVVGGIVVAGPRDGRPRDLGSVIADGLATPTPAPALPRPVGDATPRPTQVPAPTPEPWIAAADGLAASTFAENWTGRIALDATLRVGDREPATWTLAVARTGDTEWSRSRIAGPGIETATTEIVLLARTVFERVERAWERRDRGFGDQPTEPLFGVRDASDLVHVRTFKEDGRRLHEFRMTDASDLLALGFLRAAGSGALDRRAATVVADDAGRPVRASLTYSGATRAGRAKLVIEVTYRDVDGTFTIRSPKDGDPVVD